MIKTRSDIPFSGDDAHAFLPWVIGIMACMATLLLCFGITVGGWIVDRGGSYSTNFTVNIPATSDELPKKVEIIEAALTSTPGITHVSQVSNDTLRGMLKPWLGDGAGIDLLPLPVVLDVTIDPAKTIDYKNLQNKMNSIATGTEVDAHERWVSSFSSFSAAIRALMTILASLIIGGLGLMIAFMSRAALKLHARTVNLLHSIGAEDQYIMRQFQLEAFMITLHGTIPGSLLAGLGYWIAGVYMTSLQSSVLPPFTMHPQHAVLVLFMPLACSAVSWLAARISVLKQLQRSL